jgi:predicted site-specific integrase-resolvase
MTVSEATKRLGVTKDFVYRLLQGGTLAGTKRPDGAWDVDGQAVEARIARLAKRDRRVSTFREVGL